jgi:hypothetical protein
MESSVSTVQFDPGLEDVDYVRRTLTEWRIRGLHLPESMIVVEFWGDGDPFFGGKADDRSLGINGSILARGTKRAVPAVFATLEHAHEAAKRIPNRRAGSVLGVMPTWRSLREGTQVRGPVDSVAIARC